VGIFVIPALYVVFQSLRELIKGGHGGDSPAGGSDPAGPA